VGGIMVAVGAMVTCFYQRQPVG